VQIGGIANTATSDASRFAQALAARGVDVVYESEAFSSAEAARFAPKGKSHDDAAAAAIILQRYLDMRH
jgi:RNase H-fold protein (predicted Holliday junction resolvase)